MKRKLLLTLFFAFPLIANADTGEPFPSHWRGIHYAPIKNINLPAEMKDNLIKGAMKNKGFIEKDVPYVQVLLNMKRDSQQEIKSYKNNSNVFDTHLKSSLSEIKLSVPFKEINFIDKKNVIGFAAGGGYSENKNKEGWTGVGEFFTHADLGTCRYDYDKILAVELSNEYTEYLVNGKPSVKSIEGNYHSGFLYTLNWYKEITQDELYQNTLECANMKFDKEIMTKMIALANTIDKG